MTNQTETQTQTTAAAAPIKLASVDCGFQPSGGADGSELLPTTMPPNAKWDELARSPNGNRLAVIYDEENEFYRIDEIHSESGDIFDGIDDDEDMPDHQANWIAFSDLDISEVGDRVKAEDILGYDPQKWSPSPRIDGKKVDDVKRWLNDCRESGWEVDDVGDDDFVVVEKCPRGFANETTYAVMTADEARDFMHEASNDCNDKSGVAACFNPDYCDTREEANKFARLACKYDQFCAVRDSIEDGYDYTQAPD